MSTFTIRIIEENGKIKIKTSGIPENGNLSELHKMGLRIESMAKALIEEEKPLWKRILSFILE